ncbi:hypothetical protein, partial [Candidatus Hodarchaeum mangrovi]
MTKNPLFHKLKEFLKQKKYLREFLSSTFFIFLSIICFYLQILYETISAYFVAAMLFLILGLSGFVSIFYQLYKNKLG